MNPSTEGRTMRKAVLAAALVSGLTLAIGQAQAQDDPIVLDWLTFTNVNSATGDAFKVHFIDELEERSDGRIKMHFRGGMDTVAVFDQGAAVQSGLVDIAQPPVGFYEAQVPGVGATVLSQISLEEERKPGGAFDYLVDLHKKYGMMYLGRAYAAPDFFYLGCNKQPQSKEDFADLRIGTATATQSAVEGWGATVVSLGNPEYYAAMERGVIDCLASTPLTQYTDQGIGEVTDYIVDKGYFRNSQAAIMNLETWESMPDDLQKLTLDVMTEYEKFVRDELYAKDLARQHETLRDKMDVQFYDLKPEAETWMVDTARNATWDKQAERYPEVTADLRAFYQPEGK